MRTKTKVKAGGIDLGKLEKEPGSKYPRLGTTPSRGLYLLGLFRLVRAARNERPSSMVARPPTRFACNDWVQFRVREMSALTQDLRYALRTFSKTPGSTAVAIVVLSLGIGANAAIFSVTSAVLFRPLPYKDPASLVFVWESNVVQSHAGQWRLSAADFRDFRSQNQVLDRMGAMLLRILGADGRRDCLSGSKPPLFRPACFEILGMNAGAGTLLCFR